MGERLQCVINTRARSIMPLRRTGFVLVTLCLLSVVLITYQHLRLLPAVYSSIVSTDFYTGSIDQLAWTSLNNGSNNDINLFSAYYDGRKGVPGRPAVVVLGYNMRSLKHLDLRCVFTYTTRTSVCLTEPAEEVRSCIDELAGNKLASAFSYLCRMKCKAADCTDVEIPAFVALSNNSDCASASGQIPVRNQLFARSSEKKTFGVCVEGPVRGIGVQQISEFIEMNRVLGAESITLYVMEMKDDELQFLVEHFSKHELLQLVKWRNVNKRGQLLHYFGQSLIMHDCLYRNMYRVKYLAMADLDELFLPLKHQNWFEMITAIGEQDDYHSYLFSNCYYMKKNGRVSNVTLPCQGVEVPKYFQRTSRSKCYCDSKSPHHLTKYIMQTELIVGMYVHSVCKAIQGEQYKVPHNIGVTAHYRNRIPKHCAESSTQDTTLLKYQSIVVEAMGQYMCSRGSKLLSDDTL